MSIQKFQEFTSVVGVAFWQELGQKKLDELKLSEEAVHITGFYGPCRLSADLSQHLTRTFLPLSIWKGVPLILNTSDAIA